jgi:hypothetical protein
MRRVWPKSTVLVADREQNVEKTALPRKRSTFCSPEKQTVDRTPISGSDATFCTLEVHNVARPLDSGPISTLYTPAEPPLTHDPAPFTGAVRRSGA